MNLTSKLILVGIANALVGFIVSTSIMFLVSPNFKLSTYTFWPSVLLTGLITGSLVYAMFEFSGTNAKMCK